MTVIGNILWFVLGGVWMGIAWFFFGLIAFISVVGMPWGRACFTMGALAFFPFGKEVVSRKALTGKDDLGTGMWGVIGNIIWFVFAGFWLAIGHLCAALVDAITIIGIPFAVQHLKLAQAAIAPIGKAVVAK